MNKKEEKLLYLYENKLKDVRKEYYKNLTLASNSNQYIWLNYIPTLSAALVILLLKFTINSYLISLLIILVSCLIINFIQKRILKINQNNNYSKILRKNGYFTIKQFEKDLKEYITGPTGFYSKTLETLKIKHNITDKTKIYKDIYNENYYIWFDKKNDSLNILSTNTLIRPIVKSTKLSHVRYYRKDNNNLILKTDLELYIFDTKETSFFDANMPNKKFENFTNINYEEHIADFEMYMHKYRNKINQANFQLQTERSYLLSKILIYIFILALLVVGISTLNNYKILCITASFVIMYFISIKTNEYINSDIPKNKNEAKLVKEINENKDIQSMFKELKAILNVKDSYDTIYSTENAPYLTWTSNGYFHIFLNIIYFNVVFISVKVRDVNYYKCTNTECEISTKMKTLYFKSESKTVFDKILPNKDYDWINGKSNTI